MGHGAQAGNIIYIGITKNQPQTKNPNPSTERFLSLQTFLSTSTKKMGKNDEIVSSQIVTTGEHLT